MAKHNEIMLVADDVAVNRAILSELFSEHFTVLEAENGVQALECIRRHPDEIAVVLLDIVMPELDGFAVLRHMNENGSIRRIPVVIISGEAGDDAILRSYGLGVSDVVHKPFCPEVVVRRVLNVSRLHRHQRTLEERLQEQKTMLEAQAQRIKQANLFVIDALSTTVEFRNMESGQHIRRIRLITRFLLEGMRELSPIYHLPDEEIEAISNASALHDIGKIAIPDAVLLKPGPLSPEEFSVIQTHPLRGCEILESLNGMDQTGYFRYSYEICRHHHERWDGKGYPDGLKGDEISLWAQATSLADVYDALTSERVYKRAIPHRQAVRMILRGECGAFNPDLLACFSKIVHTLPRRLRCAAAHETHLVAAQKPPQGLPQIRVAQ